MKPTSLLADNWTLQCVGSLLSEGLSGDTASELTIAEDLSAFSYLKLSADVLNVQCLFQTLSNVVFSDTILVDKDSVAAWLPFEELSGLYDDGVVVPKPFQDLRSEWLPIRAQFIDELCVCPAMRALHEENVRAYKETGESKDRYFGQLIWGGAGMLARAHLLEIPYCGHPAREAWFSRVGSLFNRQSAEGRLQAFISEQRVKVLNRINPGGYLAVVNLPAVAALAIHEAREPADLIKVALQLRKQFEPLRLWLREFQAALDTDTTRELLAREKVLQSVARNIDAHCSTTPVGDTTVQIGLSWLKATFKVGSPINRLHNLIGVRALMNRLVLAPAGAKTIRKLVRLFGEGHSALGHDLEQALRQRNGADAEPSGG